MSAWQVRGGTRWLALVLASAAAAAACSGSAATDDTTGDDDASDTGDDTTGDGGKTTHRDAAADASKTKADGGTGSGNPDASCVVQGTGVPADVAAVFKAACTQCHSDPPKQNAPDGLVTYADLTATSQTDPSKSVAEEALALMQKHTMPPTGVATAAQIATVQAWVTAGTPEAMTCTGGGGKDAGAVGHDAGTGGTDAGGGADASNPYGTPPGCTTGVHWSPLNGTGATMRPGEACFSCHSRNFAVAGTVYKTAHEDTDCDGDNAAGLKILILNGSGQTQATLTPNQAGNFTSTGTLTKPYTAKVVDSQGNSRQMTTPQTSGDCNSCHTQNGANGAPGRIMAP